jgi:cellulose synthase (UDP-forming)
MRLKTRHQLQSTSKSKLQQLPKTQTQKLVPPWIWTVFIASLFLFVSTIYFTSWTSTGPTFLPPELSNPTSIRLSPLELLNPHALRFNAPGVRYLPEFLEIPADIWEQLLPTGIVIVLCLLTRLVPTNNWTRLVAKSILIVLAARYMIWRTLGQTMNFTTGLSSFLSIFMYAVEVFSFVMFFLNSLQTIWSNAELRSAQADRYTEDILSGTYLPSVDVFVPTHNEPEFIVRRTAVGCQAINYPNKKVYILDDTGRPHIRALAQELGCGYVTYPSGFVNKHAKAGNLNNALPQTDGELIVVMDSDFVPFKNFLTRTVGFFQQPKVAIVQTPQDFYNPDHHVRNLGVDHLFPNDLAVFFRYDQSTRDAANTAMCCGTSYVMRRSCLEAVGGYFTRCVSEDSSTSTLFLTRGYRVIYLNEALSMGESTRNYADFMKQRLRWLQGNLQIFCCPKQVPIWTKLNLIQQSYMVVHLMGCFQPLLRVLCLITPLISLYLGVSPIISTAPEIIYFGVPYLLLLAGTTAWASEYHASYFFNQVYETIFCFPGLKRLYTTLKKPFGKGFAVTPKGVTVDAKNYNLRSTLPLLIVMALTLLIICLELMGYRMGLWEVLTSSEFSLIFFWLVYNFVIMGVAVLAAVDQPERRLVDRFPLRTVCKLTCGQHQYWGHTNNVSETGANITLITPDFTPSSTVELEFLEHSFAVDAEITRSNYQNQGFNVSLKFNPLTIPQSRKIIEILYTNLTWWKQAKRLGGIDAFFAIFFSILKLRPILTAYKRRVN